MSTPVFIITAVNEPIAEAATKGKDRSINNPAFYTLNTPEGQVYAGSTGSINKRLSRHKGDLVNGKHLYIELQRVGGGRWLAGGG